MFRFARLPYGSGRQVATGGSGVLVQGMGCVTYSEAYETTGSASAGLTIWDGTNSNGRQMIDYTLQAGQSTSEEWAPHWMPFEEGLYLGNNTGTFAGSLTVYLDHDCVRWLEVKHLLAELEVAKLELELAAVAGG